MLIASLICMLIASLICMLVSFQVIATFVILNMMIALILEEYGKALNRDKHRVSADHAELFVEAWAQFDPYATGMMHVRHLHALIRKLPPPLGLDPKQFAFGHVRDTDVSNYISKLEDIKSYVNEETGAPEVCTCMQIAWPRCMRIAWASLHAHCLASLHADCLASLPADCLGLAAR